MYVFQFQWHARVHTRMHTRMHTRTHTCTTEAGYDMFVHSRLSHGLGYVHSCISSNNNNNNAIFLSSVCKDHEQSGD